MSSGARCMRCFTGTVINGVCDRCHRAAENPDYRSATALPSGCFLHGRYTVGEVLGSGGFGITYAAWDNAEQRRVALKELFPSQDVSREQNRQTVCVVPGQENYFRHISQCFVNEASLIMKLQGQQGIISIYNLFNENNTLYYSMEFLEGMDLRTYLQHNGKLTWQELTPVVKSVLRALHVLHGMNLIHRDISPDNIFLTGGQAQLIDFGSVRTYQGTKSFTTFMKHSFAPWEQYQSNGRQGPWTDIYAISVTIYYALSGVLPPKAPDRKLSDTLQHISTLCPQLPGHVADALHKGMSVAIPDRYQSAGELYGALFPDEQFAAVTERTAAEERRSEGSYFRLICRNGCFRGRRWLLKPNQVIRIGRQPQCELCYPDTYRQISGMHCTLAVSAMGELIIRDESSRNGTWINGVRLTPGRWYNIQRGSAIIAAQDEFYVN